MWNIDGVAKFLARAMCAAFMLGTIPELVVYDRLRSPGRGQPERRHRRRDPLAVPARQTLRPAGQKPSWRQHFSSREWMTTIADLLISQADRTAIHFYSISLMSVPAISRCAKTALLQGPLARIPSLRSPAKVHVRTKGTNTPTTTSARRITTCLNCPSNSSRALQAGSTQE
jgi:hypothetical protein